MHALLWAALVAGLPAPTPLDAFRSNMASVKVELDYTLCTAVVSESEVTPVRKWEPTLDVSARASARVSRGNWGTDGVTERFSSLPPQAAVNGAGGRGQAAAPVVEASEFEMLYDGDAAAWHDFRGSATVVNTSRPPYFTVGPFMWFGDRPFPAMLNVHFKGLTPRISPATKGGSALEVETYEADLGPARYRVAIFYDPAIGFLPRYVRALTCYEDRTYATELFLIEAAQCKAGGFFPLDWYSLTMIHGGDLRGAPLDGGLELRPTSGTVVVNQFHVVRFGDLLEPVSFRYAGVLKKLNTVGGSVGVAGPVARPTLAALRTRAGRMLSRPARSLPQLDVEELHRFHKVERGLNVANVLAVLFGCSCLGLSFVLWRRRFRRGSLILLSLILAGCGRHPAAERAEADRVLDGRLVPDKFLVDAEGSVIRVSLNVRNTTKKPLLIYGIETGCSCRKVDVERFPVKVPGGETRSLSLVMNQQAGYLPQRLEFLVTTDVGNVVLPLNYFPIPKNRITPESLSLSVQPNKGPDPIRFVHREVFPTRHVPEPAVVAAEGDASLVVKPRGVDSGVVSAAPEYSFRDTDFEVEIRDLATGFHKSVLEAKSKSRTVLARATLAWNSLPFLSTTPAYVVLYKNPVRVFLRCPDEDVEFDRVLTTPVGVKARLSSPREVTILASETLADDFRGVVEVSTSAAGQLPVKIPIRKYRSASLAK